MRLFSRYVGLALLEVALARAGQPLRAQAAPALRPIADHHVHLQSRADWELFNAQLPFVTLPADLDGVLREFEHGWQAADNKIALSEVFTEDGILQWGDDWIRGRPAIRMMLVGRSGGLRMRPQAFETDDRLGYIAGAYGFYRDTTWVDQGRYVLTLRRARNAPWRITVARLGNTTPPRRPDRDPFSADDLIAQLDSAGMRRGVALSYAYQYGAAYRRIENEAPRVRAENDWVAEQVARYPGRLVGFCSFNPLKEYALEELDRCMRDPRLTGVKMHFTTSFVDLRNRQHIDRLRAIFRSANARRFPIVVHMRTMNPAYGRADAEIFLRDVLAEAPDVPVQIAHLAGWGGYDDATDQALSVFAEAIASGDRRTANLYFDLSAIASPGLPAATTQLIVRRIRQIGIGRMLFAVDGVESPGKAWETLHLLPLDSAEFRAIAGNLAPYLR